MKVQLEAQFHVIGLQWSNLRTSSSLFQSRTLRRRRSLRWGTLAPRQKGATTRGSNDSSSKPKCCKRSKTSKRDCEDRQHHSTSQLAATWCKEAIWKRRLRLKQPSAMARCKLVPRAPTTVCSQKGTSRTWETLRSISLARINTPCKKWSMEILNKIATPCKLRVHHQQKSTNRRILQVHSNHTVQVVLIIRQQAKATRVNPAAIMAHLWRRI